MNDNMTRNIEIKKEIDFSSIEKKWQKRWDDAKLGEAEPNKNEKFFLIFAYPGISGYLHVGHMRGYSYSDAICRYKRMNGYNVLFPVGTHASGNPSVIFANKIRKKDSGMLDYLKNNGYDMKKISNLETPKGVVDFFNKNYVEYWKRFGFLIDERRFICTINPDYNKFIEWQFKKLKEKNLLVQKPYYGTFCPKDGPVAVDASETDISKGGNAERMEFTLLKFKFKDKYLVAATLRPETVYGQTNLWINTDIKYVEVKVGKEIWIISEDAFNKLTYQKDDIKLIGYTMEKLLGEKAVAPMIEREVIILPSRFVKSDIGTGIVTSVPSDAPYDYIALKELQELSAKDKKKLGFDINQIKELEAIKVIPIIQTKKYGEKAGVDIVEKEGVSNQEDPKLEGLTQEVYKEGYHSGILLSICGKYSGMKVIEAKDKMKDELIKSGKADIMYSLSEEVICRCGERVIIKKIDDQWFIRYSDFKLTKDSKEHAQKMLIYPEDYKRNIPSVLEWFQDRACARQGSWLGTKMPFGGNWIIEPISDSTLYPVYYIVSKYVNTGKIKVEELTEEFFDYVYLGIGKAKNKLWESIKKDFDYWYPLDINLGGKEHQTVHFPVFLMNHVAILPENKLPKGIFVNYWITGKGSKISKSKGGSEPVPELIQKYSVDGMRLYYAHIGSPAADVLWDEEVALSYRASLEKINLLLDELMKKKNGKNNIDAMVESTFNKKLKEIKLAMDNFDFRTASNDIYFNLYNEFKKYLQVAECDNKILSQMLTKWIKLMVPITPHIAEELWEKIGGKGFVSVAEWPSADESKINEKFDIAEKAVEKTVSDIVNVLKIIKEKQGKEMEKIYLYVLPNELENYDSDLLSKKVVKKVKVFAVNDKKKYDPEGKAAKAKPGKPGIYAE